MYVDTNNILMIATSWLQIQHSIVQASKPRRPERCDRLWYTQIPIVHNCSSMFIILLGYPIQVLRHQNASKVKDSKPYKIIKIIQNPSKSSSHFISFLWIKDQRVKKTPVEFQFLPLRPLHRDDHDLANRTSWLSCFDGSDRAQFHQIFGTHLVGALRYDKQKLRYAYQTWLDNIPTPKEVDKQQKGGNPIVVPEISFIEVGRHTWSHFNTCLVV